MQSRRDLLKYFAAGTVIAPVADLLAGSEIRATLAAAPKLIELPAEPLIYKEPWAPFDLDDVSSMVMKIYLNDGRVMEIDGHQWPLPRMQPHAERPLGPGARVRVQMDFQVGEYGTSPSYFHALGTAWHEGEIREVLK